MDAEENILTKRLVLRDSLVVEGWDPSLMPPKYGLVLGYVSSKIIMLLIFK